MQGPFCPTSFMEVDLVGKGCSVKLQKQTQINDCEYASLNLANVLQVLTLRSAAMSVSSTWA